MPTYMGRRVTPLILHTFLIISSRMQPGSISIPISYFTVFRNTALPSIPFIHPPPPLLSRARLLFLTVQLTPSPVLTKSAAATHCKHLTSNSYSVLTTLGEFLVSFGSKETELHGRSSCLTMFPTVECNGKSKRQY